MDQFKETFVPDAEKLSPPDTSAREIYLLPPEDGFDKCLIVGPYEEICQLNADLRKQSKLHKYLSDAGVRYGTRREDISPFLGEQFKLPERLANTETLRNAILKLEAKYGHARYGELDSDWKSKYATKSNHAHHVVPDMVPRNTGTSTGLLIKARAPAALIRTEVHQQLFHKVVTTQDLEQLTKDTDPKEVTATLEKLLVGQLQKNGERQGGLFNRPGWQSLAPVTLAVIREIERTKNKG